MLDDKKIMPVTADPDAGPGQIPPEAQKKEADHE